MAPVPRAVSDALLSAWGAAAARGRALEAPAADERAVGRAALTSLLAGAPAPGASAPLGASSSNESAWSDAIRSALAPRPLADAAPPIPQEVSRLRDVALHANDGSRLNSASRAVRNAMLPLETAWLPVTRGVPLDLLVDADQGCGVRVDPSLRMFHGAKLVTEALGAPPERRPLSSPVLDDPRSPKIPSTHMGASRILSTGLVSRTTPVSTGKRRGVDTIIGSKYTNKRLANSAGNPGTLIALGPSASTSGVGRGDRNSLLRSPGGNRTLSPRPGLSGQRASSDLRQRKMDRASEAFKRLSAGARPIAQLASRDTRVLSAAAGKASHDNNVEESNGGSESPEVNTEVADEMMRMSHRGYAAQKRREEREAQRKQALLERQQRKERSREKGSQDKSGLVGRKRGFTRIVRRNRARPGKRSRSSGYYDDDDEEDDEAHDQTDVREDAYMSGDSDDRREPEEDRDSDIGFEGPNLGKGSFDPLGRTRSGRLAAERRSGDGDGASAERAQERREGRRVRRSLRARVSDEEGSENSEGDRPDGERDEGDDGGGGTYQREVPRASLQARERSSNVRSPARDGDRKRAMLSENEAYLRRTRSPSAHGRSLSPKLGANGAGLERFRGPMRPHETAFQAIGEFRSRDLERQYLGRSDRLTDPGRGDSGGGAADRGRVDRDKYEDASGVRTAPCAASAELDAAKRLARARNDVRAVLIAGGNELIKENSPEWDQIVTFFLGQGHDAHWNTSGPGLKFALANPVWDQNRMCFTSQRMLLLFYPNAMRPTASWQVQDMPID